VPPAPAPLPPALKPAAEAISGDLSPDLDVAGGEHAGRPTPALQPALIGSPPLGGGGDRKSLDSSDLGGAGDRRVNCAINSPPNVVQMPGTRREDAFSLNSKNARPLPRGWARTTRVEPYQPDASSNGSIHPDVVARSALKDPLALDAAFNGFNSRRKRPW
jgi:hypothetical protein